MSRYKKIKFDRLQMYFGDPYVIDLEGVEGNITVFQPTIGDVVRTGEVKFYNTINIFVSNTTSYRSMLWDAGVDWNELSDFELFIMLYQGIDDDVSKMLFGDLDWKKFNIYEKRIEDSEDSIPVLYDAENHIEINEEVYQCFHQYIQTVFNMFPEEEITEDKMLKKWWVEKDKRKLERDKKKDESSSSMQSIISACVNHPGFKYKLSELKEIGVCQFYDSVNRLQIYENATACMKGMYSGFVDGSKINPDSYNFMKDF